MNCNAQYRPLRQEGGTQHLQCCKWQHSTLRNILVTLLTCTFHFRIGGSPTCSSPSSSNFWIKRQKCHMHKDSVKRYNFSMYYILKMMLMEKPNI